MAREDRLPPAKREQFERDCVSSLKWGAGYARGFGIYDPEGFASETMLKSIRIWRRKGGPIGAIYRGRAKWDKGAALREQNRIEFFDDLAFAEETEKEPSPFESSELKELVDRAISKLEPLDQLVIRYWMAGFSRNDLVRAVGMNSGTVGCRIHRAQQRLKLVLQEMGIHSIEQVLE